MIDNNALAAWGAYFLTLMLLCAVTVWLCDMLTDYMK